MESKNFYLNDDQCRRVNSALDRIEALPREVGEIVINTTLEGHLRLPIKAAMITISE